MPKECGDLVAQPDREDPSSRLFCGFNPGSNKGHNLRDGAQQVDDGCFEQRKNTAMESWAGGRVFTTYEPATLPAFNISIEDSFGMEVSLNDKIGYALGDIA
jgi:hypothetical protein